MYQKSRNIGFIAKELEKLLGNSSRVMDPKSYTAVDKNIAPFWLSQLERTQMAEIRSARKQLLFREQTTKRKHYQPFIDLKKKSKHFDSVGTKFKI